LRSVTTKLTKSLVRTYGQLGFPTLDGTDGAATTVKEIAAQTGMSVPDGSPAVAAALGDAGAARCIRRGGITASVAETAARLPEREQQMLADHE
jgi:hypothetical protein